MKQYILITIVLSALLVGCASQKIDSHPQELSNVTLAVDLMRNASAAEDKFSIEYDLAIADDLDSNVKVNRAVGGNANARQDLDILSQSLNELDMLPDGTSQNYSDTISAIRNCVAASNETIAPYIQVLDNALKYDSRENLTLVWDDYSNNGTYVIDTEFNAVDARNSTAVNNSIDKAIADYEQMIAISNQQNQIYHLNADDAYIKWETAYIASLKNWEAYFANPYSPDSIAFMKNEQQMDADIATLHKAATDTYSDENEAWRDANIVQLDDNISSMDVGVGSKCQLARQTMKDKFDVAIVI